MIENLMLKRCQFEKLPRRNCRKQARIMRLVSTTSRTLTVPLSLAAHGIDFRLDLLGAQIGLRTTLLIGIPQHSVESLGEQTVNECLSLLRRKLPRQLLNLLDRDGNGQRGHDVRSLSCAVHAIK
jgi:hypothetical protein